MILIIGAGLSGITLARYLGNHDVPYIVFEQAVAHRPQGFGLTLRMPTVIELLDLLGLDEPTFRRRVTVDRKNGRMPEYLVDAVTGEKYQAGHFQDGYSRDFRNNRERLRHEIQGDVKILFDHKLKMVKRNGEGVIAEFENGKIYNGDLIVAADGVHSLMRRTYAPHIVPKDWPAVMFNGITRLSEEEFNRELRPIMGENVVLIGCLDNTLVGVTMYDVDPEDGTVSISWALSRRLTGKDDPLFSPYSAKHEKTKFNRELFDELESLPQLVKPFNVIHGREDLRDQWVIQHQLVSLLIPKDDLLSIWHDHKVVFIGDSVHDWTNHAGTAANAAIIDAIRLGQTLQQKKDVTEFYEDRAPAWQKALDHNGQDFESLHRTREEWQRVAAQVRAEQASAARL